MASVSAKYFFMVVASLLTALSAWLIYAAQHMALLDVSSVNLIAVGGLSFVLIVLGLKGPLKLSRNTMPMEPRKILLLAGSGLIGLGAAFWLATLITVINETAFNWLPVWGLVLLAVVLMVVVVFGQLPFAISSPVKFTMGEFAGIITSAGFNQADNIANAEMNRWTGNKRDGVGVGHDLIDAPLFTLELENSSLAEVCDFSGFTVLNFASYTCPHHRRRIEELRSLKDKYPGERVQFVTIYTAEAHPVDGWVIPGNFKEDAEYKTGNEDDFCIAQAKTLEQRRDTARMFINNKAFNWPVYLDTMENGALYAYNSWPIRLYLVRHGKIVYCGDQGPFGYQPDKLEKVLVKGLAG